MRRLAVMQTGEQPADHRRARARNAGDERRALPGADRQRAAPAEAGEALLTAITRGPVAHAVAKKQQKPVDDQEHRRNERRGKEAAHRLFEDDADHDGRQRGDDDEPQEPSGFGCRPAALPAKAGQSLRQEQPVAPEIE